MNKETLYRSLTLVTPIVAVLCAGGVSVYEWQRLKRLEGETTATQGKLTQIDHELRSYEAQPQMEKYPTVTRTPREQAMFLDSLRANADACKVQLVRWSNTTPAAVPAAGGDKSAAALPAGVTAIVSIVEVAGRAENSRAFLYNVLRSRRLLNMTDLKWVRDTWPNTHLTFTLTRYVAPPIALPGGRAQPEHAHDGDAHGSASTVPNIPATGTLSGGGTAPQIMPIGASGLPNPMDAPGIAHGAYQSRLDAGVSQLSELDRSQLPASPRPPNVTNAKH